MCFTIMENLLGLHFLYLYSLQTPISATQSICDVRNSEREQGTACSAIFMYLVVAHDMISSVLLVLNSGRNQRVRRFH